MKLSFYRLSFFLGFRKSLLLCRTRLSEGISRSPASSPPCDLGGTAFGSPVARVARAGRGKSTRSAEAPIERIGYSSSPMTNPKSAFVIAA